MDKLIHRIDLRRPFGEEATQLLRQEWLVTNGLGGYASGTIAGTVSWRYHGMLVAALPAPLGRTVMLNHLAEFVRLPNGEYEQFSGEEPKRPDPSLQAGDLVEFRLENGLPVWRFELGEIVIEKQVLLVYGQNTAHITYRLVSAPGPVELKVRPSMHFRHHETQVCEALGDEYVLRICGKQFEIQAGLALPPLRMTLHGLPAQFTHHGGAHREVYYFKEAERGNAPRGVLWTPGAFTVSMRPGQEVTLIASTETWNILLALSPAEAVKFYHQRRKRLVSLAHPQLQNTAIANLVLAADQFIITPAGRIPDAARAHAGGDEIRTIIAGYHWFTDWGRDTMISLEGLTLCTGRKMEAGWILRMFAHHMKDGLIPNMFPDKEHSGIYNTADATLWFFHALARYVELTGDRHTLQSLLPQLVEMGQWHLRGTDFGIGMDPEDGLLRAGAPNLQLTWMDAKVDNWVVTPRRGKPVEINALWYNALRLLQEWVQVEHGPEAARPWGEHADKVKASFNRRFWNNKENHLYDVVDGEAGDDSACRPNQLLAIALPHAVLEEQYWAPVLDTVQKQLLTPVGLRTLSPEHEDYKAKYFGDLRARDAAYHQGTVWAWLIGPFIEAWLKVHPEERKIARGFLEGFVPHLDRRVHWID